jgi:hypothetical protein
LEAAETEAAQETALLERQTLAVAVAAVAVTLGQRAVVLAEAVWLSFDIPLR